MTAHLIPFPLARRIDLIRRQARRYTEQGPAAAENTLQYQLSRQREAMERKGLSQPVIDREVKALELAIRALAWQLTRSHGGAA